MSALMHAVRFANREGLALVGIVHEPAADRRLDVAILLLSPGVKNRVAPHRLYNKMAASLVAQGYWVFRFDFYGLGDSEGFIGEPYLADFYGTVGRGRYVADTCDAMDWMRQHYPVSRFVVGGLCGGAITGVLAAPQRSDVAGILGLGLPVMLEGRNVDKHKNVTSGQLNRLRGQYLKKLASPRAWTRLLSFRSDWRMLARAVLGRRRKMPRPVCAPGAPQPSTGDNTNVLFAPAFLRMLDKGCPALLLFSEMDRLWWEFEEKFFAHHKSALARYGTLLEVGVVAGANHIFTLEEWQTTMMSRVGAWLDRQFRPQVAA